MNCFDAHIRVLFLAVKQLLRPMNERRRIDKILPKYTAGVLFLFEFRDLIAGHENLTSRKI